MPFDEMALMYKKLADICGCELPTNLQNFTQKDSTEVKILQKFYGGYFFFKHPVYSTIKTYNPEVLGRQSKRDQTVIQLL